MKVWDAFIKDYGENFFGWSLRFILEAFWHFSQDGSHACDEFLKTDRRRRCSLCHGTGKMPEYHDVEEYYPTIEEADG